MSIITEYPNANIRNFFNRYQLPVIINPPNERLEAGWGRRLFRVQNLFRDDGEYNNRHDPRARNGPDEQHLGTFQSITLNYDPTVNPEIYRYIDDAFKPDGSLPDIQNDFITGNYPEQFGYYLNTIVPLTRMYRKYFKVVDNNNVTHIYVKPVYQGIFNNNLEMRKDAYLGVYDKHLMGDEIPVHNQIGEYLTSRVSNSTIVRNVENARVDMENQVSQGGNKRRKSKTRKSKRKKSKKNKSRKNKSRRYKV